MPSGTIVGIMNIVRFARFMFFRALTMGFVLSVIVITSVSAQKVPGDPVLDNSSSQNPGDKSDGKSSKNMNVDMQLTYGQYNNMFSACSFITDCVAKSFRRLKLPS